MDLKPPTMNYPPRHGVTLALIARDEASVIARCLESAKSIADELIVVDTGSKDATREIARNAGASVIDFPWVDDFSAARNAALEAATGRWILVLDADEYLPASSARAIRDLLAETGDAPRAFHLLNKSSSDDGRTGVVGKIVRLFPNRPDVRYAWPVHEQVVTSLRRANIPIHDTEIEIIHTGYTNAEVNLKKQTRNLRILDSFISSTATPLPMAHFLRGGALLDLGRTAEALECYTHCQSMLFSGEALHEAAMVRRATCLADLHRFADILLLHPASPQQQWHPELLVLRGQAELMLGDPKSAVTHLNLVFESPDAPSIPAYDPVRVRARAILLLAEIFKQSAPSASIAMLRLVKESLTSGCKITLPDVLALPFP